jgi:hypothetical protein
VADAAPLNSRRKSACSAATALIQRNFGLERSEF